ncbi:MAG: DUF5670 family protein [Candidatus Korobacteraceae bacterium]
MTWTFFVILLAGWTAGVLAGNCFGGALHLLLLGAIVMLFVETLRSGQHARN